MLVIFNLHIPFMSPFMNKQEEIIFLTALYSFAVV